MVETGVTSSPTAPQTVRRLRQLALRCLRQMYRPQQGLFAFRLRDKGLRLEGVSRRYTAIALIGLANVDRPAAREVLSGQDPFDVCTGLLDNLPTADDLGEVALTVWASRVLEHPGAAMAMDCLTAMSPARSSHPTVEVSWALAGLTAPGGGPRDAALADAIAERLVASFGVQSKLFSHWPRGARHSWVRAHAADLADQLYPIMALCTYHIDMGRPGAASIAGACARKVCELQGPAGQWWWLYDVRTGGVIEQYPVYAVHQDSMVPMALKALREAGGQDCGRAIERGLAWLEESPEITGSLVDERAGVIWRKVARHEPGKLVRRVQAAVSRAHPRLRVPGMDLAFPPGHVDRETRPYHLGWILHAWPAQPELTTEQGVYLSESERVKSHP